MSKSSEASASIFGWQFQINASIYLMIKYFGRFEKMKLESKEEDIEIILEDNKKIYAQAKAKQKPLENNADHSTKLHNSLKTLSSKNKNDAEKLIYVNNLEPNPLNSGTDEFDKVTFWNYDDLSDASKDKINTQLKKLGESKFQKNKFAILRIPFYGNDETQRLKYIDSQIAKFLVDLDYSENYSTKLLDLWQTEFLHNATIPNNAIYIEKENIIWTLIVMKLKNENDVDSNKEFGIDEEHGLLALEKYEKFINYKEGHFAMVNELIYLYDNYKQKNENGLINDFINTNISEIFKLVFDKDMNEETSLVDTTCAKIVARLIIIRKLTYTKIIKGACNYGD